MYCGLIHYCSILIFYFLNPRQIPILASWPWPGLRLLSKNAACLLCISLTFDMLTVRKYVRHPIPNLKQNRSTSSWTSYSAAKSDQIASLIIELYAIVKEPFWKSRLVRVEIDQWAKKKVRRRPYGASDSGYLKDKEPRCTFQNLSQVSRILLTKRKLVFKSSVLKAKELDLLVWF